SQPNKSYHPLARFWQLPSVSANGGRHSSSVTGGSRGSLADRDTLDCRSLTNNSKEHTECSFVSMPLPIRLALRDATLLRNFLQCVLLVQLFFPHNLRDSIAN